MKIESYTFPTSSFLSLEKDFSLIIKKLMQSENIKRLLFYNTRDALKRPALTKNQEQELINKNIKIVPKVKIDEELENYLVISFDTFSPNASNPEFRDNLIIFDIVCHIDQWMLQDFQLRPYKIAGEIDFLFNDQRLTGIGKIEFMRAQQIQVDDNLIDLCLIYRTVHGEEDKKGFLNPKQEQQFIEEFNKTYNND